MGPLSKRKDSWNHQPLSFRGKLLVFGGTPHESPLNPYMLHLTTRSRITSGSLVGKFPHFFIWKNTMVNLHHRDSPAFLFWKAPWKKRFHPKIFTLIIHSSIKIIHIHPFAPKLNNNHKNKSHSKTKKNDETKKASLCAFFNLLRPDILRRSLQVTMIGSHRNQFSKGGTRETAGNLFHPPFFPRGS